MKIFTRSTCPPITIAITDQQIEYLLASAARLEWRKTQVDPGTEQWIWYDRRSKELLAQALEASL